jgi:hypothetical protein
MDQPNLSNPLAPVNPSEKTSFTTRLKNFFANFIKPSYYISILSGERKFHPFLALWLFAFVTAIVPSYLIIKNAYPVVNNLDTRVQTFIDAVYPSELKIQIENGKASTNVSEPYYVSVRKESLESLLSYVADTKTTNSKLRLLAIDTKGKADDFERYQSYFLLTETSLVYYNQGNINIYPLNEVPNMAITKDIVKSKAQGFLGTLGLIGKILILLSPLFVLLGIFIFQAVALLFASFTIWLIAKINQVPTKFKFIFNYAGALFFGLPMVIYLAAAITEAWKGFELLSLTVTLLDTALFVVILGLAYTGIRHYKKVNLNQ